uniref:CID domain-containing protein n=1 Tax=Kwoniella bestiolae CBS 10118 TaxID=1296100 RepID=A0A1B9G027_9TREE|nr:hypothetical protein I302_05836 [Kwoniella bestiolae CBS 10118]OCF24376.1 hypothetical protein I302_05836 [Kwoniella bestiolae CBS 10118]
MAELKEFDKLLTATITAPRLSGSKVQKLASLSSELVVQDHQIVTTFFKLNASLPHASQSRISSLYVFDAIARGAKSDVNKGIGAQVNKERGKGTQAGMLLKLEGVVDSWIEGLLDDGKGGVWTEGKEKSKKIVDIWSKAGTFPQHCLERLTKKIVNAGGSQAGPSSMLKDVGRSGSSGSGSIGGQGKYLLPPPCPCSTTPPYPPPAPPTSTIQPGGLPPEVAKLLGIAASSPSISSPPVNGTPGPNPNTNGTPPNPIIPNLDLAAILASVNKPPPGQTQPQSTIQAGISPINIPYLANLASLLPLSPPVPPPQNAIPPTSIQSPQHQQQDVKPQPRPPPHAGPSNPILNAAQSAALAKFAALAQAGPPRSQWQAGQSHSTGPPGGARRSPQKGYNDLPAAGPMRAEPMRGAAPPHRGNGGERSENRGQIHGKREPQDWGRRGSSENDHMAHGRVGARQRDRSRSPRRFNDRPSDSGWGDRNGGGNNQRGRGGFSGNNAGSGSGYGDGPQYGYNNRNDHAQFQFSGPPQGAGAPLQGGSNIPTNGLPPRPGNDALSGPPQDRQGRAPPPAWMDEKPAQGEEGGGEEDMTLDDGSDDGAQPSQQQHQQQQQNNGHNRPSEYQPQQRYSQNQHQSQQTNQSVTVTLDTFPIQSFNPSQPESWASLAEAWKNSMGREPNQMELMAFLAGGMGMDMGGGQGNNM